MKKALSLTLILIGTALLIAAGVFWIDSNTSAEPQNFSQSLRDWTTLLAGLGASIKGWIDLFKRQSPSSHTQSNTYGGIIFSGNVDNVGKDVIGRDQVITTNIVSEDTVYNVEGLPNPYLGLQAFTYEERESYAGRERLTSEALQLLVSPGEQRNLLFVTGASGSGKSSFVQASLLPVLENYYQQRGEIVNHQIFRPSRNPKARLDEALRQLGSRNVQILIIDQFEELFTQSVPNERTALFSFLQRLPPFEKKHRFVICTLRSDYLGEMFDVKGLWEIAKQGIELREMKIQELKDAIICPLQAKFPNGNKRIDPKLIEKLAADTAESVTYLPLLQVTLEEIWNKGQLRLGAYNLLTDAIKERADIVLSYEDFDKASPIIKRTDNEREEILGILLDLVNPSPDNDVKHDVRISRKLMEFDKKQIDLLRELSRARLISIEAEDGYEVVNLIHEALIRSWDVLSEGVKDKRIQLQKRSRFEEQLRIWISNNKGEDYLLSKGQLTEMFELKRKNDIALRSEAAQEFMQKSEIKLETEQKQAELIAKMERRVRETIAINRVSQGINITLTLDDILELIYAQTAQMIPLSYFCVMFFNKTENYFYYSIRVDGKESRDELINQPLPPNIGLGQIVISSGRPIVKEDYLRECQSRSVTPSSANVRAWIGVPLTANTETIGALCAGSGDSTIIYSREQLDLLQAIADQTAGAVVKARLLQETQQRANQLSALNEITRQMSSTLDPNILLQNILENAVNILNCEAGILFELDEDTDELIFRVTVGPIAGNLIGQRLPPDTGIVGRAVTTRVPVIENDAQRPYSKRNNFDKRDGFVSRSILAIPMLIKDRVLGVIEVINRQDGLPFVADDQNILIAFAGQAAVAIENVRLYALTDKELAVRVEELQVMSRIMRELNASLELDRALRITLDWAMRQSSAEAGLVGMLNEDTLRIMVEQGYEDIFNDENNNQLPLTSQAVRDAIKSGQSNQVSLIDSNDKGILSFAHTQIIIPIRREMQVIGLILLESTNDTQINLDFLNRLSDNAAIAISNAQLYAEIQRANLAKSDFVSFVAHELKNPMTSIKGYTELLSTGAVGQVNEMQTNFLDTIQKNVQRMSRLVSDLNDNTRIEAGRFRLDYRAVNLSDSIDSVIRSIKKQFDNKNQVVTISMTNDSPLLWVDQIRLEQILDNLLSNANLFSPEGSEIVVGSEVSLNLWDSEGANQVVHIWVKDNGIGISTEDQKRIFQKFFRSDDSKARETPGTGLGLNITKSLVEMQGGRIWFESEYRIGTTFHFTIPVAEG